MAGLAALVVGFLLSADDAVNDRDVGSWPFQHDLVFDSGIPDVAPSLLVRGNAPLWYFLGVGLIFAAVGTAGRLRRHITSGDESARRARELLLPAERRPAGEPEQADDGAEGQAEPS